MARLQLSDEIIERLAAVGAQNDITAWELGDLTLWILEQCRVSGRLINPRTEEEITPGVVYNTVGKHAGKSPEAIRDYLYTSKRVPISIRKEYHMLGRHHLKALCPHFQTVGELRTLCEKVLDWSQGDLISVAALRLKLAAGGNGELAMWAKRYKRTRRLCKLIAEDEECPTHLREASRAFRRASVPLP